VSVFEYVGEETRLIRAGGRAGDKLRLLAMSLRHHLAARSIALPGASRENELRVHGFDLRVRANDYFVLFEVLSLGAYDIDFAPLGPVRTVLDLGANIGLATLVLSRALGSATTFLCVEPAPSSFALLERNLRRNTPGARALNAAATAEPTTITVREGAHPALSSVQRARRGDGGREIAGMTIGGILDAADLVRVDLVKLDVEGAERELFDAADGWRDRVGAILAEIHPPLSVEAAAEQLAAHGYRRLPLPPVAKFAELLLVSR
jgi:FkbM family methyltransferase